MQAYFENRDSNAQSGQFYTAIMGVLGLAYLAVTILIFTGWIALGERANVSRRDINFNEWAVAIGSALLGIGAFRTAWGLAQRERVSWAWLQWVSFVSLLVGFAIAMSAVLGATQQNNIGAPRLPNDVLGLSILIIAWVSSIGILLTRFVLYGQGLARIFRFIAKDRDKLDSGNFWGWFFGLFFIAVFANLVVIATTVEGFNKERFLLGVGLFVFSAAIYSYAVKGSVYTPDQRIRIQLAESPSAGAIIGLVVIVMGFSMASDLFLDTTSIASILSNNATKGIIAIGITTLMISGEFDLSVGSVLGVTAMAYMIFMGEGFKGIGPLSFEQQPTVIAAILALICACIMGLINGLLLVTTKIPSFIVTLGTLFAYRAIALVFIGGGRILRYRDYFPPPAEFPQVFISRWAIATLAITGALFILVTALQAIPQYWSRSVRAWSHIKDREMGSVIALGVSIWSFISAATLATAFAWLALVAYFHLDRVHFGKTLGQADFWLAIILGLAAAAVITAINLYPSWRKKSGGLNAGEAYSIPTGVTGWILWIAIFALIVKVYDLRLNLSNPDSSMLILIVVAALGFTHVTLATFRQYRLARQQVVAVGERVEAVPVSQYLRERGYLTVGVSAALALLIVALIVTAYQRFGNIDSPLKVGFFDVANGQWRFTMAQVTRGLVHVNIPDQANLRNAIAWWVILASIFQVILFRTRYGNSVFAVGGNRGAARAQGINVNRVKVQNFVLCSFLTGLAGIMEVARNPGVDPLKGNTWELDVIAMTVIGGTLLTGGYGSIIGTMLGVLIFGMLGTGLVLVGMDSRMFQGVIGVIMIGAVVLNNTVKRSRS
ncbi:MAG: hypothetical protein HY862_05230 [Chloroflexi bacterium]|nr:hypothetical protein [Chloroflexota bacterium]